MGGKPLVQHSIEAALGSKLLTEVVVSSDSEAVLQIASKYETVIALRRPDEFASDTSPAIEYVQHCLAYFKNNFNKNFDAVVILQPSSPLTLSSDIDATIDVLIQTKADSAVSVMELPHDVNPLKMKVLDIENKKLSPYLEDEKGRMAAHELPKIFVRNCAVYATMIASIEQNKIIGDDCRAFVMPRERSVDINDPLDFEFAAFLFQNK